MPYFRRNQRRVVLRSAPWSKKFNRDTRCLTWCNLALGSLIPLSIGAATVFITLLQQQVDDRRQKQEKQLDDRRYDQERLVNDRRYILEQFLANLTREKDFAIEEQRREQEQRQADDLHFQLIFKSYIEDVSNILYKSNQSFVDNGKKLQYISSKTMVVLDELDWTRKTRVFQFLHKNKLLPQMKTPPNTVKLPPLLDLTNANLANIFLHSTSFNIFKFEKLALSSVDLRNASFIECNFEDGASFSDSAMNEAKFTRSNILCPNSFLGNDEPLGKVHALFVSSTLIKTSFDAMYMCGVQFKEVNLFKANFSSTLFQHGVHFIETNLTETDFRNIDMRYPSVLYFFNSNLRDALFDNSLFQQLMQAGSVKMKNVILPNNSWLMTTTSLVVNGNAEKKKCQLVSWAVYSGDSVTYPKVSPNPESLDNSSSRGRCIFNFTSSDKLIAMFQSLDVADFTVFLENGADYEFLADVNCHNGGVRIILSFYAILTVPLSKSNHMLSATSTSEWLPWTARGEIPKTTRSIKLEIFCREKGECLIDNIELHIKHAKNE